LIVPLSGRWKIHADRIDCHSSHDRAGACRRRSDPAFRRRRPRCRRRLRLHVGTRHGQCADPHHGDLATLFFITSLGLGLLARYEAKPTDILDRIPAGTAAPGGNVLDQLPGAAPATTPAPATNGAAAPAANGAAAPAPAAPKADPNAVPTGN
jgi:hypothetical protein